MQRFILLALLVLGLALCAPRAWAQSNPSDVNIPAETESIRDLLQQAMRMYRESDYKEAYKLSRGAYLDHFENIEIPLRVLDPDLTLDMEYRFADLRTKMQAGASATEVEQSVRTVRAGLDEIDAIFSSTGALAPLLAFVASFTIIFREGLEAVLVLAALLGFLRTAPSRGSRNALFLGIGLALLATVLTWLLLRFIISITPVGRELLEAVVSLIAVGMLFWVSFWLISRLDREHWMEFLRARASASLASSNTVGLLLLGFTAVFREGFETALFYEVLLSLSQRAEVYVLFGFLAGAVALGIVAWLILRAGQKLPIRKFMRIAVLLIMMLSVAFIGAAARTFQESGFLNATSLIGIFPRLPRPLAEFTGIHPTVETLAAQVFLAGVYIIGGVVLWWKARRPVAPSSVQAG